MLNVNIEKYLTPYKLDRPVITGINENVRFDKLGVDVPFVFFHNEKFYMMYVGFDGKGYQTGLAVSDDLIHWERIGIILGRDANVGWDKTGAAGTWIIKENDEIEQLPKLKKIDGRYWLVYHAYPGEGYEVGAGRIGLAWCENENLLEWHRLEKPILVPEEGEEWEKGGLYKACIIEQEGLFYMFYNAKNITEGSWIEQIGIAFSKDLIRWKRYKNNPIIKVEERKWDCKFCSDPYVVKDREKWVMFYYGFDGKHAQNGIAFSEDLLNWVKYPEPVLRYGEDGEIDEIHAHKPAVVYYNGILYHFYCAVRNYREGDPTKNISNEFRCISVATSVPIL
jgi:predicted GH43/DUF377 family glycosyl hydrolase